MKSHLLPAGLLAVAPLSEDREHVLARLRRDRFLRHVPYRSDGESHLLDVRVTSVAACQVLFDQSAFVRWQRILEIRRDQLNQLTADDLVRGGMMG